MIFHMPQKKVEKPGLQINGAIIEYVNNFLRITINNHLNRDSHINKVGNKVSKITGILNKLKHFLPQLTSYLKNVANMVSERNIKLKPP